MWHALIQKPGLSCLYHSSSLGPTDLTIIVSHIGLSPGPQSHYLNECWNIVDRNFMNKRKGNVNRNSSIFIKENTMSFEIIFSEICPFRLGLNVLISPFSFDYHSNNCMYYVTLADIGKSTNIWPQQEKTAKCKFKHCDDLHVLSFSVSCDNVYRDKYDSQCGEVSNCFHLEIKIFLHMVRITNEKSSHHK